jgi:hypothetical protein
MTANDVIKETEYLKSERSTRDSVWQDIRELVRPATQDFNQQTNPGDVRTTNAYDSTAIDSCKELAAGLHSYLTSPSERWFSLCVTGFSPDQYDEDALAWLEVVSDIIYGQMNRPLSGFHTCMHECFLDIAAFGTSTPYQEYKVSKGGLIYKSFPMADIYLKEDSDGMVDTVVRRIMWDKRQLMQEFESLPPKVSEKKDQNFKFEIIHWVGPRKNRVPGNMSSKNKAFGSYWVCVDTKEMIEERGYDSLPYHPGRWEKLAGQAYGESPASTCLPDILMLNAMERTIIRAGQKQTDPPIIMDDEGFSSPISTAPGSIIWKEPGTEMPEAMQFKGNLPWAEEKADQKREQIRKCFHADWLRMEKENKEMTAFEVADRRNEKLGLLSPNLGRIHGEQLGPLLSRSYQLLHQHNHFPPAPPSLQKKRLNVVYVSPAARAQMAIKANESARYVQEMISVGAVKPEVLDYIDWDMFAKKQAEYRSITQTILRSSEDVEAIRNDRKQMEQLAQISAAAEPATKALKNVAEAQSKGMNLG